MNHLFLIGFMGAGKSTVGRRVADALGMPFIDLDEEIERAASASVTEIFAAEGERAFRAVESAALASLADAEPSVVACGGGVVVDDENRRLLRELGRVVYLRVEADEALARIGDTSGRPLLAHDDAAAMASTLLAARETLYRTAADAVVDTSGTSVAEVASEVVTVARSLREAGG